MKIPKTLKIGGHQVKILYPYVFTERYDLAGQYDAATKEIKLADKDGNNKRANSDIMVTFLHEILHAVDINSGHKIFNNNEAAIEGIGEGLFQVLIDNGFLKID
jgi:hypothetical protein